MQVSTMAYILSYLKYGETSAIVRIYTREKGFKNFIWKGIYSTKNKKRNYLFPLNKVHITYKDRGNDSLEYFQTIETENGFRAQLDSIEKQTLLLFFSEILNSLLRNEPENIAIFDWLDNKLKQFSERSSTQMFAQEFLLELSAYLGIQPQNNYEPNAYFDLESGSFTLDHTETQLNQENSLLWHNFLSNKDQKFNKHQRWTLLQNWIAYFQMQIPHFSKPNSLEVIKELFQ